MLDSAIAAVAAGRKVLDGILDDLDRMDEDEDREHEETERWDMCD